MFLQYTTTISLRSPRRLRPEAYRCSIPKTAGYLCSVPYKLHFSTVHRDSSGVVSDTHYSDPTCLKCLLMALVSTGGPRALSSRTPFSSPVGLDQEGHPLPTASHEHISPASTLALAGVRDVANASAGSLIVSARVPARAAPAKTDISCTMPCLVNGPSSSAETGSVQALVCLVPAGGGEK